MTTEALKSTPITDWDASPVVRLAPGAGGHGRMRVGYGSVTATTGMASGSTYRMVRLKSNQVVVRLYAWLDASVTTFTCDIGVYYSTSTTDGTPAAHTGASVSTGLFGTAVALASIVTMTEYTTESGTYTAAKRIQPLWQAGGLSADPGGYLDIVFGATATSSGAPVLNVLVEYLDPAG